MATNSSNTSQVRPWPLPSSTCIPWLVLHSTECLAIVILNLITITVFVKQRQLQRRSTYLIIHLVIVDLLVGAVSGPMQIHFSMILCYGELEGYDITYLGINLAIRPFFPFASLVNLTFISLERAHATYRPFKHRFIKKWVYGVVIALIYFLTVCKGAIEGLTNWPLNRIWVYSSYLSLILVICLCYILIFIKVHCDRRPKQHSEASLRERKLTRTLFLVTCASVLTFLPISIYEGILYLHIMAFPKFSSDFQISSTILTLFLANSLINPLLYAVRMPEFRAGISKAVLCERLKTI